MTLRERLRQTGRSVAAALVGAAAVLSLAAATHAQGARAAALVAADSAVSNGMNEDNPAHELLLDLQQMHLTACATSVQQVMTFLFDGQPAHFIAEPLGPDSDRWPSVFVIESAAPAGGRTRLSTLMIAPNCAGMYEQVIYWSQLCNVIKSTVFAKFTGDHVLLRDVQVSASGPALEVYLTPAGSGCVSVKKELFR